MASKVNETTAFKITGLEPNRWMLWQKPHSACARSIAGPVNVLRRFAGPRQRGGGFRVAAGLRESRSETCG